MDNKTSKYNNGEHIPYDSIPINEMEIAISEFAAGSIGMEKCLRELWMNGVKTYSCNPGDREAFDIGHIVIEEGKSIFIFLSDDFILDPRVRIDEVNNMQEVKFAGTPPEREAVLLYMAREIQKGRRRINPEVIAKRIGEPFPEESTRKL